MTGDSIYGAAADGAPAIRARQRRTCARPSPAPWRDPTTTTSCRTSHRPTRTSEIERGNPDLDPTTSWNFDLLYENYFTSVGVVSAGVFYKDLYDYIFLFRSEEDREGETST